MASGSELDGRVAVVTGANRGIGLELVAQLADRGATVVLGSRDPAKGEAAARERELPDDRVIVRRLDVTAQADIDGLASELESSFGRVDVLVNNAAINYDTWQSGAEADLDVVSEAFDANVLGAWRMSRALIPLLVRSDHARIVNVSSESGSLASMGGGSPAYSVSKAALNALTRVLAAELRPDGVLVNSVCPGWVATDMGGPGGRPVEEGAASVLWAALVPDDGPSGGFFRDGQQVPW